MDDQSLSKKISTIVVSRPGVMRQALGAALALLPQIEITGDAGGGLSALNLICKNRPALLIIDWGLPEDEMTALLRQSKQEQLQLRCLVLAETSWQQETALAMGADVVVLRSEPTERLVQALKNLELW